jgi:hypothetical protein
LSSSRDLRYQCGMSTPQDSPRRRKQKARRTKQLAEWREKKATAGEKAAPKKKKSGARS